jgi:hypothetical protein
MSYRIEYQWASFLERSARGDRFVIAIEGGDNNVWTGGKRARSWSVCMLGSADQVLRQAVYFAGACEGGGLKPGGRNCSPEAYIRRIRRLVEDAGMPRAGRWYPSIEIDQTHPAVQYLAERECERRDVLRYGRALAAFELREGQRGLVFDLAAKFPDLMAWNLAKVSGLPAS